MLNADSPFFITYQAKLSRCVTSHKLTTRPELRMPGQSCITINNDGAGQLIVPNSKGYLYGRKVITAEAGFGNCTSQEEHLVVLGC